MPGIGWSDAEILDVMRMHEEGKDNEKIAKWITKNYGYPRSKNAVRYVLSNYKDSIVVSDEKAQLKLLKDTARTKRNHSYHTKTNRILLDHLNTRDDIIGDIRDVVLKAKIPKARIPEPAKGGRKKKMTIEVMVSDVHVGKKTETFDLATCEDRLNQLVHTLKKEVAKNGKDYHVEKIIVALLGDIIESFTMHGEESAKSCEFGNSRQVAEAVRLLFYHLIDPIAHLGIKVHVPCVTGNHDRTESKRTYHYPGESNLTYIIYTMLKLLAKERGLSNVTFDIPKGPNTIVEVYGNNILYEHGDNSKACTENALEALLNKRQTQLGVVVDFLRVGHWHSYTVYGRGRIIVNDSVPGADSYSEVMGFNSHAGQTINFYVETKDRPNCFYKSFPVYLV